MICTNCGKNSMITIDTRYNKKGGYRRRNLMCTSCGHRDVRYEISSDDFHRLKRYDGKNWWALRGRINRFADGEE